MKRTEITRFIAIIFALTLTTFSTSALAADTTTTTTTSPYPTTTSPYPTTTSPYPTTTSPYPTTTSPYPTTTPTYPTVPQPPRPPVPVISYSIPQAIAITKSLTTKGEISNDGISNSIITKLEQAQDKLSTNRNVSKNLLEATIKHIEAQSGVHVSERAATLLIGYINNLIRLI